MYFNKLTLTLPLHSDTTIHTCYLHIHTHKFDRILLYQIVIIVLAKCSDPVRRKGRHHNVNQNLASIQSLCLGELWTEITLV